ncbi:MAG TPA: SUMF1/EgtB/PvdO family nonheme iron enzyme [Flavipsychrobacter sp.]|nr:SUMF1/EgtB/PvdO family nonheme iron enzyme [Flavipsychrobacter sp.]
MHLKNISLGLLSIIPLLLLSPKCFSQRERATRIKAYKGSTLPAPAGMAYVKGGSILIKYGQNDSDSSSYKQVSLSSFFIDKTEVSNAQYRQFVNWVIDSIAVTNYLKDDKYFKYNAHSDSFGRKINWRKVKHNEIFSGRNAEKLAPMYNHDEVRKNLYVFAYAHLREGAPDPNADTFEIEAVNVYPDTKVWATDFPNSQNDIMVQDYFNNPAYDQYPVVGVNWKQAMAYTSWRSRFPIRGGSKYLKKYRFPYSLPSEAQWVYAQGEEQSNTTRNVDSTVAPRDGKDRLVENFKQNEGDYTEDGSSYTAPVMSYAPNEYGIYNMSGNVSEWVLDAYKESAWAFVHDQNPVLLYDADSSETDFMKRKVVRGGSWKDNASSLSPYTRDYEVQDVSHSYIGFRCVMPAPEILGKKVATRKYRGRKNKKENKIAIQQNQS